MRVFATIGAVLLALAPARAADESAWEGDTRSAARLISGGATVDAIRAGVEIRLGTGWKTYWRYPGDSGIPPRFDTAGSDNVRSVTVLWPAPHRFTDGGGTSIGYKKNVIFPLHITPRDPGKPVTLRLKLDYAVCERLCVPAEATLALPLTAGAGAHKAAILAAEALIPKAVALGAPGALTIASVRRVANAAKPLVAVDVVAPGETNVELFAEGVSGDWALPVPMPAQGAPVGRRHFGFELDGLPPGVDPNRPLRLRLTAVAGAQAIEVTTYLD